MTTVSVEEAQQDFSRLIGDVALGEHVVIMRGRVPIAELVPIAHANPRPMFGSAKGMGKMSEDFDAPIEDSRDYTE